MIDVAIVGAGAAGIGAARRLAGSGLDVLLVEAGDRIGGRAHTVHVAGHPLDLGCGWLHSAGRNPWVPIAEAAGLAVDRSLPKWDEQYRDLGFTPAEQQAAHAAYEAFDQRLRSDPPASDRAADALSPGNEWNAFAEAISGYVNGAGLGSLSVEDYLAYDTTATDQNWRLPAGYGTLVATSCPRLPLALATPITRIDHTGRTLRLEGPRGTIEARTAIVAVPTTVIANCRLHFTPELADHQHAAATLPLGLANKLFFHLNGVDDLDPDRHLIGNPRDPATGSYHLRPFGRPLIEAFFGGEGALELEREGPDATATFARHELAKLFGSDLPRRLRLLAASAWGQANLFGGSYSHALPGHHASRAVLRQSVADRLFFAGEAVSEHDFSTAHGALASGIAAAERVLAAPR